MNWPFPGGENTSPVASDTTSTYTPILLSLLALLLLTGTASAQNTTGSQTLYFPSGFDPADPDKGEAWTWEEQVGGEWLGWGESVEAGNSVAGNFTVTAFDFELNRGDKTITGVQVKIFNASTGQEVASTFYLSDRPRVTMNYRNRIKVRILDVRDNGEKGGEFDRWINPVPQVQLNVDVRKPLRPEAKVTEMDFYRDQATTEKADQVFANREVYLKTVFENPGEAPLHDTTFEFDLSPFQVLQVRNSSAPLGGSGVTMGNGEATVEFGNGPNGTSTLTDGSKTTVILKLKSPVTRQRITYNVSGKMSGENVQGIPYNAEGNASIDVFSSLFVSKDIRPDSIVSTNGTREMYLTRNYKVIVTLRNTAESPAKIRSLTDSMPDNFAYLSNATTQWKDFSVGPGSVESFSYEVTPVALGDVEIAKPEVNFTWNDVKSNESFNASSSLDFSGVKLSKGDVNGPLVVVNRSVTPKELEYGESGNFSMSISNVGNSPTRVHVSEKAPDAVTPLDPPPEFSTVLGGGDSIDAIYRFRAQPGRGNVTFKSSTVTYVDLFSNKWRVGTNEETLTITGAPKTTPSPTPNETSTSTPTTTRQTPSTNTTENVTNNATGNASDDQSEGGFLPGPVRWIVGGVTGAVGGAVGAVTGAIGGVIDTVTGLLPI